MRSSSRCRRFSAGLTAAVALALFLPACAGPRGTAARGRLPDGIYAVVREASTRDSAAAGGGAGAVLVYDRTYTDAEPLPPPSYVAIDTASFVPLILEGKPVTQPDGRGHALLSVTLAREHVKSLEDFTSAHLGGRVAILLDGEVITMHKVRAVVREGKLQITRCGDNACEVLRAKLTK